MAPVFLAVTNEVDASDSMFGLQRKCKSIEDLCSSTIREHPIEPFDGRVVLFFEMFTQVKESSLPMPFTNEGTLSSERTTLRFDFLRSFYGLYSIRCFSRDIGRLVTSQQKC